MKLLAIGLAAVGIMQIGSLRGWWMELTAPRLRAEDLQKVSLPLPEQRRTVLRYAAEVCRAFDLCAQSTRRRDAGEVIRLCRQSANEISGLQVPTELPDSVVRNLEIYQRSMLHGSRKLADQWDTEGKDGGSFWTHLINWEIDTCSVTSLPQRVFQLYGLPTLAQKEILTCEEIVALEARLGAADSPF